ncbi:hypothetical protein GCM10009779_53320 [Polymorphospora rubra]|uniref:Uncharacterized protein n=1 Tax=Polymorphospora rubra TaxID=338584 RepID=A0A810N589_9ACTN|nr:hypothetical protein Prubr_36560 [Polymorphospora rubra]
MGWHPQILRATGQALGELADDPLGGRATVGLKKRDIAGGEVLTGEVALT